MSQIASFYKWIRLYGLVVLFGGASIWSFWLVSRPEGRDWIRNLLTPSGKVVLSRVSGQLFPQGGPHLVVTKIRYQGRLAVEVYRMDATTGAIQFWQRLPLKDLQDAYLNFSIRASNLGFYDMDQDGVLEIIAPTYDQQLAPHLNIFRYNKDSQTFSLDPSS